MTADEFIALVRRSPQQQTFFHFTDTRNLPSIRQNGLLSMRELRNRGIVVPAPGGNDGSQAADRACGMDAYVHLCFMTGHPMVLHALEGGRILALKYLQLHPDVVKAPGAMITDDVANQRGIVPQRAAAMFEKLDLEVMYTKTNWADPVINRRLQAAHRCELLVPSHIAVDYIVNLGNG